MQGADILSAGAGTVGGGLTVGTVAWFFFRGAVERFVRRADALEAALVALRDRDLQEVKQHVRTVAEVKADNSTMEELKARVTHIERNCRAETNAQAIEGMKPVLARIEGKVDSAAKDIASVEATMKNWEGWIADVRKEERETGDRLFKHLTDSAVHGGQHHA